MNLLRPGIRRVLVIGFFLLYLFGCGKTYTASLPEECSEPVEASSPTANAGRKLVRVGQICTPREGVQLAANAIKSPDILSPKSVNFSPDGSRIYINALEGCTTLAYSFPDLRELAKISHVFTKADAALFREENTIFGYTYHNTGGKNPNVFSGKPVEAAFSHNGRYLWIPYYRRSFDANASSPSAVAIIDTASARIVRVMPTGPLPKVVAVSPAAGLAAISHWGDNTVGLIDISGATPDQFVYTKHLVVGQRLSTAGISGDRDRNCGYCLRGTVFSPDGKYLLVGRMGGGGITVFSLPQGEALGSLTAFCNTPRHLTLDPTGRYLYASNNREGTISRVPLSDFLAAARNAKGKSIAGPTGEKLRVGQGARTITVSPDGTTLYAAINNSSELLRIDLPSWTIRQRVRVSPYAVGLDVSPDGTHVIVTSQGKEESGGGNSVEIFRFQ